ncbi:E3 ubiquitin-protein ligase SGR9, amyloplastic [Momordica charantia]|uniref:RING-type E3 ubiquitin transferase n=1 Tax=Momordica charantia TaxID=3673 RepID=A0A6J1CX45_MOMCH|nr:E3 ubiquitin-protein ligase SGR9, amyloplastic [Momordica charantia]
MAKLGSTHKKVHISPNFDKGTAIRTHDPIMEELEPPTVIMAALSALSPLHLSDLSHSIFSDIHHRRRRLTFILSSPTLFSLTLRHLNSLSLSHKSLLIARFLLSALRRLCHPFQPPAKSLPQHPSTAAITPRDLDAAVLLLLLCEVRQHNPAALETPLPKWRAALCRIYSDSILSISGIISGGGAVMVPYVETVARCWKFVGFVGSCGGKGKREVAASPVAVVELPSVAAAAAVECVICKEEMGEGRDACQLPCEHLFHWLCILPWLRKRNTCPCCRFQLPTDDVFAEIQRLWEILLKLGSTITTSDGD